jgi:hypothetical protein
MTSFQVKETDMDFYLTDPKSVVQGGVLLLHAWW